MVLLPSPGAKRRAGTEALRVMIFDGEISINQHGSDKFGGKPQQIDSDGLITLISLDGSSFLDKTV